MEHFIVASNFLNQLLLIPVQGPRQLLETQMACDVAVSVGNDSDGKEILQHKHRSGFFATARTIHNAAGWSGFFTGSWLVPVSSLVYNATYFSTFAALVRLFDVERYTVPVVVLSLWTAGLVSQPFDVVQRRMQLRVAYEPCPSAWRCAKDIVAEEGVSGLFRGYTMRAAITVVNFGLNFAFTNNEQ